MAGKTRPGYVSYSLALWIVAYAATHGGNAPVQREMAAHFNVHMGNIQTLLRTLYSQGVVERLDGKLCVVGSTYVPPAWYIQGTYPPLPVKSQLDNSRRNSLPIALRKQSE